MSYFDLFHRLPPAVFRRDPKTNAAKLWRLHAESLDELDKIFAEIERLRELSFLEGRNLDRAAATLRGPLRSGLSDSAFRWKLGLECLRQLSGGSVPDMIEVLTYCFGEDAEILAGHEEGRPASLALYFDMSRPFPAGVEGLHDALVNLNAAGIRLELVARLAVPATLTNVETHISRELDGEGFLDTRLLWRDGWPWLNAKTMTLATGQEGEIRRPVSVELSASGARRYGLRVEGEDLPNGVSGLALYTPEGLRILSYTFPRVDIPRGFQAEFIIMEDYHKEG